MSAPIGTITLNTTDNGVSQAQGILSAPNLLLTGTGTFTLPDANNGATLAANLTGPLTYNNAGALTIGVVQGTVGVTASGGVTVTNTGAITVLDAVTSSPGPIHVTATANLTVSANVTGSTGATVLTGNGQITIGTNDEDGLVTGTPAVIDGGPGNDTITVNISGNSPLTLDGQGGNDLYQVAIDDLGNLVSITDPGTGNSTATILEPGQEDDDPVPQETWVVTSTFVTRQGSPAVLYAGLKTLNVNASGGQDLIVVDSTSPNTTTNVNVGGGQNNVIVSSTGATRGLLTGIEAPLNLLVGGTQNVLTVSEAARGRPIPCCWTTTRSRVP